MVLPLLWPRGPGKKKQAGEEEKAAHNSEPHPPHKQTQSGVSQLRMGAAEYESQKRKEGQERFALLLQGPVDRKAGFSQINVCSVMKSAQIVGELHERNEISQVEEHDHVSVKGH
jgi:hypothetical protein